MLEDDALPLADEPETVTWLASVELLTVTEFEAVTVPTSIELLRVPEFGAVPVPTNVELLTITELEAAADDDTAVELELALGTFVAHAPPETDDVPET